MLGEDLCELLVVLRLQQVFDGTGRQLGEGLIGRSKDRERTRSFESGDQACRLERGAQRLEFIRLHGGVDDILLRGDR